jgi:hypothetical protein
MFGKGGCTPPIELEGWTDYHTSVGGVHFLPLARLARFGPKFSGFEPEG